MPSTRPMKRSNSKEEETKPKPSIIDGNPKRGDTFFDPYDVENYSTGHQPLAPDNTRRVKHMAMLNPDTFNKDIIVYGDHGDKHKPVEVTGRHPYLQAYKPVQKIHKLYPEFTLPVKISSRGAPPGASLSRRKPLSRRNALSKKRPKKGGRKTRRTHK